MAGYSGTPLIRKIGIKPGHRIHLHDHPETFLGDVGPLPEAARIVDRLTSGNDVVVCFVESEADLRKQFSRLADNLATDGMLWIAWPKRASGRITDLDENVVRNHGLKSGLVDVKVCAIDEVWSGLKFVIRLIDRSKADRSKVDRTKREGSKKVRPGNARATAAQGKKKMSSRRVTAK